MPNENGSALRRESTLRSIQEETYHFLYAIKKRSLKPLLEKHLAGKGLIVGVSAGAIVLTPHIGTAIM
jgi:peptidase E